MALADAAAFAVAYWPMEEASGTRADSVGSNDLTDNNTVGSNTGMFGNCAELEASNSEYFSLADNSDVSMGNIDMMLRCWVKFESFGGSNQTMIAKWDSGTTLDYILTYTASVNRFRFIVRDSSENQAIATADNFGAPSAGVWYLIHAWHDATGNVIGIAVNAGTANTTAHTTGIRDGTSAFRIGRNATSGATDYLDAMIDDVVILKGRFLDATERTADYNGGAGISFAHWVPTSVGLSSETDSALGVTITKRVELGIVSETDSALAVTHSKQVALGIATETDSAFAVTIPGGADIGVATETDSALGVTITKQASVGLASETDSALAVTAAKSVTLGIAGETDSALALASISKRVSVGVASETSSGLAITHAKGVVVGIASEADTALSLTVLKRVTLGIAESAEMAIGLRMAGAMIRRRRAVGGEDELRSRSVNATDSLRSRAVPNTDSRRRRPGNELSN